MNHKKGFSLISFLLYLLLFSITTIFVCQIITSLILPSLITTRKCKTIIAMHIATDLFLRDIRSMRNKMYHWKQVTPQEIVWNVDGHDIGWSFTKNRLERKEGEYNKGWKSSTTSIIADKIQSGSWTTDTYQDRIIGIEFTIIPALNTKKIIFCYAALGDANEA